MGTTVSARFWQLIALGLAWVGYSTTYLLRKPISVVSSFYALPLRASPNVHIGLQIKNDLKTELGFSMTQLGWLDTAFLLPYAASQVLHYIEQLSQRRHVFGSMLMLTAVGN